MGGLVVRYYVEKLGGAASVNTAVTIGAPHRGTKMAALGIFKSSRQFRPDSSLITGFEPSTAGSVAANMTAIWSDFDSVVLPGEAACLPEPYANVKIGGVGHVAMLFSGRVFDDVRRACSDERA
jgi:pimeloyl-ACP methyl ester carboxylesterase